MDNTSLRLSKKFDYFSGTVFNRRKEVRLLSCNSTFAKPQIIAVREADKSPVVPFFAKEKSEQIGPPFP